MSEDWDVRLKSFGYAPGGYLNECSRCGKDHIADKRALVCKECAERLLKMKDPTP